MSRPATQSGHIPHDYDPSNWQAWASAMRVGTKVHRSVDWGYIKQAWAKGERMVNPHRP